MLCCMCKNLARNLCNVRLYLCFHVRFKAYPHPKTHTNHVPQFMSILYATYVFVDRRRIRGHLIDDRELAATLDMTQRSMVMTSWAHA
jgi:hypothetical protein